MSFKQTQHFLFNSYHDTVWATRHMGHFPTVALKQCEFCDKAAG